MNHHWSARKQRLHLLTAAGISRHSALSGDRIWQCGTSSESRHKDTDQCLQVAISFCRHRSVPVPCENGSAETTVAEGGQNPVARLWGRSLGGNWPPEPTFFSYASIDFSCQLVASPATAASWMSAAITSNKMVPQLYNRRRNCGVPESWRNSVLVCWTSPTDSATATEQKHDS